MSRKSFENYGIRACKLSNHTSIAGRHAFQEEEEKRIVVDIYSKMSIDTKDNCLEVGCGTGNLLIPLSFFVNTMTGIDHEACISKVQNRYLDSKNIKLISGNFFDIVLDDKFDKIIIYSVLHCLKDEDEVIKFIFKALSLLNDGGKLLLGDIPNRDKMIRFNNSGFGKKFQIKYAKKVEDFNSINKVEEKVNIELANDDELVKFDDDMVLRILKQVRDKGYNAYILPQTEGLPFNYTREDIIIESLK